MPEGANYSPIVHVCQASLKTLTEFRCLFALPGVNAVPISGQLKLSTQGALI